MAKRPWVRGALTLALIGGLAAALIASPVGAAKKGVTKAKARQIATKKATTVFNNLIGPATAPFLTATDILAVSQEDSDGTTTTPTTQINSLSITAPAAGFLLISGQAELDNDGTAEEVCLRPRVDGVNVVNGNGTSDGDGPDGQAACFEYEAQADQPVDAATISYTVLHAVAAGAHTVTQEIISAGQTFEWFNGGLTALFVPSGSVSTAPRGTTPSRNG